MDMYEAVFYKLGQGLVQHVYDELSTKIKNEKDYRRVARKAHITTKQLDMIVKYGPVDPRKVLFHPTGNAATLVAILKAIDELKDPPLTRSQLLEFRAYLQEITAKVAAMEQDMDDDDDDVSGAVAATHRKLNENEAYKIPSSFKSGRSEKIIRMAKAMEDATQSQLFKELLSEEFTEVHSKNSRQNPDKSRRKDPGEFDFDINAFVNALLMGFKDSED